MNNKSMPKIMELLDDEYIIEATPRDTSTFPAPRNGIKRLKLIAAVACVCILAVVSVALIVPFLKKTPSPITDTADSDVTDETAPSPLPSETDNKELPPLPVFQNAQFTAEDIGNMFPEYDSLNVGTNAYTKVYVPTADRLGISPLPIGGSIGIYDIATPSRPLDEKEFTQLTDSILKSFFDKNGLTLPKYEHKITTASYGSYYGTSKIETDNYYFTARQHDSYYTFSVYMQSDAREDGITIGNELISADQRKSDEEIIKDFESVKEQLFEIFGCSFSDVKVSRKYDGYNTHGVSSLSITYYNESNIPLSRPRDYIEVYFDNTPNYADDIVSGGVLTNAHIYYRKDRVPSEEKYILSSEQKLISLEDAESLLYNGYVFGNHSCRLCMAEQPEVDFSGYDYVDIEYISSTETKKAIPFYAFYKRIGNSKNGNEVYAKTLVPAIEVSGYTEYFENQKSKHTGLFS